MPRNHKYTNTADEPEALLLMELHIQCVQRECRNTGSLYDLVFGGMFLPVTCIGDNNPMRPRGKMRLCRSSGNL